MYRTAVAQVVISITLKDTHYYRCIDVFMWRSQCHLVVFSTVSSQTEKSAVYMQLIGYLMALTSI